MAVHFWSNLTARFTLWLKKSEKDLVESIQETLVHLGCWCTKEKQDNGFLYFRYWLPHFTMAAMFLITLVICPMSVYQYREKEVIQIVEPLAAFFITLSLGVVVANFMFKGEKFNEVIVAYKEVKSFDLPKLMSVDDDVGEELKHSYVLAVRYYKLAVLVALPLLNIFYHLFALVNRELPFRFWFPYDFKADPFFQMTMTALFLSLGYGSTIVFIVNALITALLAEIVGQLALLNHNLKHCAGKVSSIRSQEDHCELAVIDSDNEIIFSVNELLSKEDEVMNYKSGNLEGYLKNTQGDGVELMNIILRSCVQYHQAIIRFKEAFDNAFNSLLLLTYVCSVIPCILGVIAVTYASEHNLRTLIFIFFLSMQMANQGVFCWLGEKINEQNSFIKDSIFGSDWHHAPESFKRSMRIMIAISNQSFFINMAGFIPLNLPSYMQVVQLVYSYYMSLTATLDMKTH